MLQQLARYTGEEANQQQFGGLGHTKHQQFVPKLDPPRGFTDALELNEPDLISNRQQKQQQKNKNNNHHPHHQNHHRDFVIAV